MTDYAWVDQAAITATGATIIRTLAGLAGGFEVLLPAVTIGNKVIVGRADFVEWGRAPPAPAAGAEQPTHIECRHIWEFKLGELSVEHELQLACYLAMNGGGEGRLMSIMFNDTRSVFVDPANATALLELLAGDAVERTDTVEDLIAAFGPLDLTVSDDADPNAGGFNSDSFDFD